MQDEEIVGLYWARDEQAIAETEKKYHPYCYVIVKNILADEQDREEILSDTWFSAWNSIPPHKPHRLGTFVGKLTRNLSLDRYRKNSAAKRGGTQVPLVLEELEECLSGGMTPEAHLEKECLIQEIKIFLQGCRAEDRQLFLERYWYLNSIREIAARRKVKENAVKTGLFRLRGRLRAHLEKADIWVS